MGEDEQRHRLVVLGAGNVGKTSIVQRFLNGGFPSSYKQTVEDLHCKDYDIQGTIIKVDILDTAGNLVFPAMRRLSISTAHAFLLVYAIDRNETFLEIQALWEQIKEQRSQYQEMPCLVVGNKIDKDARRQVDFEEVKSWAMAQGLESKVMEVSAKEDRNVIEIFRKLLEQANIPELRNLEPILKRGLSANSARMSHMRERLKKEEGGKLNRSRSLIRRTSKPKVKQTGDPTRNDCLIS